MKRFEIKVEWRMIDTLYLSTPPPRIIDGYIGCLKLQI